ncbi:DUF6597 domain-containing transcriptional factor [Kribbella sp. NPDC051587]|uniref:DUF6597 domain-containing transcriptional factor n=1 Tax=Kribbella sp. NPDC051587 TaxID=3364119 RepID=UPI003799B6C8
MSGVQSYREGPPIPTLGTLVSTVWVQQVGRDASPYIHRRVPNGAVELTCTIGSTPRVIGPHTEPLVEVLAPGTTRIGVRFTPGAFVAVARQPASELVGQSIDAEELWGSSAAQLTEAIGTASSPQEALAAAQHHLYARRGSGVDPLVSEAVRGLMPWQTPDVASLTASLHISETQLRRRCHIAVGLAPKALHRILRFQGFLALVQQAIAQGRSTPDGGLGSLALHAGYADQSHLTRECVRLTGVSPRVFFAETQTTCASGHNHAASFGPMLRGSQAKSPAL